MSSTAFTNNLAVPHAMEMTAQQTTIAIVLNDLPMDWGESRVTVVALIAFSAEGRASFQTVFDQFVEVSADRAEARRQHPAARAEPSQRETLVTRPKAARATGWGRERCRTGRAPPRRRLRR
jgi:lichenan operon transcriptional antiterminator